MADIDVRWPSEDEDFDATMDKAAAKSAVKVIDSREEEQEKPAETSVETPESTPTPVVVTEAPSEPEHAAEPVETPEHESEPTEVDPETTPEEQSFEPEVSHEEYQETAPEHHAVITDETGEAEAASEPETVTEPNPTDIPPASVVTKPKKVRKGGSKGRAFLEFILFAAVIGLSLWSWMLYTDNHNLKDQNAKLNNNPQIAIQKQTDQLISTVGRLIDLPKDETPTIANVTDAAQAKKQSAFFNSAENGDKVLMYVKAGEAILYRPSTGKIILVAPLTFNSNATSSTAATKNSATANKASTTGTGTTGTTTTR